MLQPRYVITNFILKNVGTIEACKEVIENAPLVPSFEKQFKEDAVTRTIHHGTHIEGNDLTLLQTKKVLEGESIVARSRDIQEVINYRRVVELLDELAYKRGPYEKADLLEIQKACVTKLVPDEKIGVLRNIQVVIKNDATGEVILRPPSFQYVSELVDMFFEWLNNPISREIHPILRAGITHYVLVAIHPFIEGNGRTARAFSTLVLIKEGYDIKRFFSLEENFDNDPGAYYDAFAKVDRLAPNVFDRDMTEWLNYFTRVVAVELEKTKDRVKRISIDTRLKVKIGKQVALTERQMRIVEYLTDQGGAGMKELKHILRMVSEDTILRDIRDLMDKGILKKEGSTKSSRYVISSK